MTGMILTRGSIDHFLESLSEKGRSGQTTRAYGADLNGLLAWIRTSQDESSTFEAAAAKYLTATRRDTSARTTVRRLTAFRVYAKWAGLGLILEDYSKPKPPKAEPHPLEGGMESVKDMIYRCETDTERALVSLLALCGTRISEARSVRPSSINQRTRTLIVRGKGDKVRVIPISIRAWELLEPRLIQATPTDEFLVNVSDRTGRRMWTRIAERAGVTKSGSHDGRATLATAMLNKNGNIRVVQEFLGHASSTTTEVYTKVTMDQMRSGVEL